MSKIVQFKNQELKPWEGMTQCLPASLKPLMELGKTDSGIIRKGVYSQFESWLSQKTFSREELSALECARSEADKRLKPAKIEEIGVLLGRLSLHYAPITADENKMRLIMEDYFEDLGGIPADLLQYACKQYRQNHENQYFPKASALLKLVKEAFSDRKKEMRAIDKMLHTAQLQISPPAIPQISSSSFHLKEAKNEGTIDVFQRLAVELANGNKTAEAKAHVRLS